MKLKQITLHDAIQCAGDGNVYIMIRLTDDTPVEQLRQADGYFVEESEETAPAPVPEKVEEIKPAGEFTHEDQWKEEDKPTQKKGKYDTGKICALRRASWSVAKIADEIGCSEQTVRNILKREGMV
jgi:AraC-like DNA-binding protein